MENEHLPIVLGDLTDRLRRREDLELEFKAAQGGLPNSIWETVSAFANTNGGWIVLGISPKPPHEILGVKNPEKRLQEFLNELRNPKKLNHAPCGPEDTWIQELDGESIIVIRVPAVPRRQRPVFVGANPYDGTFVRLHEGDYHCKKHEVDRMIRDAAGEASVDSRVLERYSLEDLDARAVARYRRMYQTFRPDSGWISYDDLQFLEAIGAYAQDREQGVEGITVAGLLLLGEEKAIRDWRSHHVIDFQIASPDPNKRWEDRLVWEGNLLGAYEEILPRLWRDLPSPFQLEGGTRVEQSPVHVALREALINLLVHADYSESDRSLIVRSNTECLFRNPGRSLVPYGDLLSGHRSELRNPRLVRMFRHVGIGEEAGTGIAAILHAWRELSYRPPRFDVGTDRYEFSLILPFVLFYSEEDRNWLHSFDSPLNQAEQLALLHAKHDGYVDNESLRTMMNMHPTDATKCLAGLKERQLLSQVGVGRWARYELGESSPPIQPLTYERSALQTEIEWSSEHANSRDKTVRSGHMEPNSGYMKSRSGHRESDHGHMVNNELFQIGQLARDNSRLPPETLDRILLDLCERRPLSLMEISRIIGRQDGYVRKRLKKLVNSNKLRYLYPSRIHHPDQKYLTNVDQ